MPSPWLSAGFSCLSSAPFPIDSLHPVLTRLLLPLFCSSRVELQLTEAFSDACEYLSSSVSLSQQHFLFSFSPPNWRNHKSSHLIPDYLLLTWILHEPFNVLCTGLFGKDSFNLLVMSALFQMHLLDLSWNLGCVSSSCAAGPWLVTLLAVLLRGCCCAHTEGQEL